MHYSVKVGALGDSLTITHGRQINATNTGLNYHGVSEASLTTQASTTYSTPGQLITGKSFTGRVDITGDNITILDCKMSSGGVDSFGFLITGNGVTIEGCLITAPPGQSCTEPVYIGNGVTNTTIRRCDISQGCQAGSIYGDGVLIQECYSHDTSVASDNTQHPDVWEVYGGSNITFQRNRDMEGAILADAVYNVAPWQASNPSVANLVVEDCYAQGGQEIVLVDVQSGTGDVTNMQVVRNDMDEHTNPDTNMSFGIGRAFTDYQSRGTVTTLAAQVADPSAVYWPTSGADANHWVNPDGLTPDWDGLIVVPPQSAA